AAVIPRPSSVRPLSANSAATLFATEARDSFKLGFSADTGGASEARSRRDAPTRFRAAPPGSRGPSPPPSPAGGGGRASGAPRAPGAAGGGPGGGGGLPACAGLTAAEARRRARKIFRPRPPTTANGAATIRRIE